MKNVKEMYIVFGDHINGFIETGGGWYQTDEVFPNINKSLYKEKSDVIELLAERGYIEENDSLDIVDWIIKIKKIKGDISVEEGIEILHLLEQKYEVVSFEFKTEYDGFYDEEPNFTICVRDK